MKDKKILNTISFLRRDVNILRPSKKNEPIMFKNVKFMFEIKKTNQEKNEKNRGRRGSLENPLFCSVFLSSVVSLSFRVKKK